MSIPRRPTQKPMTLHELTITVLAAELSTRPQFRGASPRDERLREIAYEWICRRDSMAMRASVEDAVIIAHSVFWSIRPLLRDLARAVNPQSMTDDEVNRVVDQFMPDDTPRYEPRKRTPR